MTVATLTLTATLVTLGVGVLGFLTFMGLMKLVDLAMVVSERVARWKQNNITGGST